eukprot:869199-Prymnesium_polylepis.1
MCWTKGWHEEQSPSKWSDAPSVVSADAISAILATLRPQLAVVTADDEPLFGPWSRVSLLDEYLPQCNHTAPGSRCEGFLLSALRWRVSLALIEKEEQRIGERYRWIIRTRPDFWMICWMRPVSAEHIAALGRFRGQWAGFRLDFAAFLPRVAAQVSLRQAPLASRPGSRPRACTGAISDAGRHDYEYCNPCMMRSHGFIIAQGFRWATVARHCQTLGDEVSRIPCNGSAGPQLPVTKEVCTHSVDNIANVDSFALVKATGNDCVPRSKPNKTVWTLYYGPGLSKFRQWHSGNVPRAPLNPADAWEGSDLATAHEQWLLRAMERWLGWRTHGRSARRRDGAFVYNCSVESGVCGSSTAA